MFLSCWRSTGLVRSPCYRGLKNLNLAMPCVRGRTMQALVLPMGLWIPGCSHDLALPGGMPALAGHGGKLLQLLMLRKMPHSHILD